MEEQADAAGGVRTPSALILEPSRDLAQQTHDAINSLKRHLTAPALQSVLLVGGTQPKEAARQLERGANIVTGTPGAARTIPPQTHQTRVTDLRISFQFRVTGDLHSNVSH